LGRRFFVFIEETSHNEFYRGESNTMTEEKLKALRLHFRETPIIPAIRDIAHLERALEAHGKVVYFLTGDPEICEDLMQKTIAAGKLPIVNLDLFNGFSRDKYAVNYLKRCGASGIISTHLDPLRHARNIGIYAIQRTFLLDSGAMETISNQLKHTPVDALEVLPAPVAPRLLDRVRLIAPEMPIVGGGLIHTMKEVEDLLAQGLDGVSISDPEMWLR
jgi:glycerol uptake operon antiterminator